jgi:predicted site-specific integrase-resolvase
MTIRENDRRQRQRDAILVYPFLDWCKMRGISVATGRRLIAAGRVKATQLSERRIGVRSDHDQEYLDSCLRDSA